jgi:hypothetical protein
LAGVALAAAGLDAGTAGAAVGAADFGGVAAALPVAGRVSTGVPPGHGLSENTTRPFSSQR